MLLEKSEEAHSESRRVVLTGLSEQASPQLRVLMRTTSLQQAGAGPRCVIGARSAEDAVVAGSWAAVSEPRW